MTPSELKHYLTHGGTTNGLANAIAQGTAWWSPSKDNRVDNREQELASE